MWFLGLELLTIEQSDSLDALVLETEESDSVASIDFGFAGNDE